MSTIVLRSVKGAALTSTEIDTNFGNLNVDKVETTAPVFSGLVTLPSQSIALTDSNLPDVAPTLNLDFANSKQLDSRITFGRGSGGAYYDGKTTAKAEENLLLNSVLSSATSWAGASGPCTFNYGSIAAPDGSFTATRCQPILGTSFAEQVISGFNIGTKSIWARTVTGTADACLMNYQGTNPQICNLTTTWQRFTVNQLSYSGNFVFFELFDARIASHTATDFLVWAPQAENRSSVTAYTPTTTAPITNYIPVLLQAPLNTPRFDHDSRPTFNGTCTVSGSAVTLPTTFADGSSPSTINKFYTDSITISGTAYVITNYVGSTRVVTVTGSPTAGAFSLVNKNYGQSLGLLIEESRENKLKYSSDFSNAIWALTAASIVNNTTISPDGTKNAGLLIASTATGNHFAYNGTFPTASATSYTFSIYVKKAGYSTCLLNLYDQGGGASVGSAFFNVSTGVVLSSIASSASITPVGNDWYRCTITGPALSGALIPYIYLTNGTNYPSTGDGYSGIYIWGAQLEAGSFATSYIPTPSNATVTRQPDIAYMSGTNFSSWYNQAQGTVYVDSDTFASGTSVKGVLEFSNTTVNNQTIRISYLNGSNASYCTAFLPTDVGTFRPLAPPNKPYKITLSYSSGNIATFSINGINTVSSSGSAGAITAPIDVLVIGKLNYGGAQLCGHIRKLSYYPKALSAPQLQGLTK